MFSEFFKYSYLLLSEDQVYLLFSFMFLLMSIGFGYGMATLCKKTYTKVFVFVLNPIVVMYLFLSLIGPKYTYDELMKNRNDVDYAMKNCKVSATNAQTGGILSTAKDAWSCPDGVTRYLPVKYRK